MPTLTRKSNVTLSLALEAGPSLWRSGRMGLDLLAGGGAETLSPFRDREDIVLTSFRGHVGAGIHVDLGRDNSWFLGLDWRREWLSDPDERGTDLGGDAWTARLSVGLYVKSRDERRLEGLGR